MLIRLYSLTDFDILENIANKTYVLIFCTLKGNFYEINIYDGYLD